MTSVTGGRRCVYHKSLTLHTCLNICMFTCLSINKQLHVHTEMPFNTKLGSSDLESSSVPIQLLSFTASLTLVSFPDVDF